MARQQSQQNQQQRPDYSPTEAGLPTADEYKPEAIGTAEVEAGDPTQTFEKYGLELFPIRIDGSDTGQRAVRRNGKFLGMVSDRYQLLPNERAVEVANDVARDLGAEPFHQFDSTEFDDSWYVQLDDHVYQDKERRRVHALYAWDDPVDVGGGDKVQFGFAVHNSIDASLSFQTGLFSFRHACANMVTMSVKDTQAGTFDTGNFDATRVEDEREVLEHSTRKHTSGLDINKEALKARIETTLLAVDPDNPDSIPNTYSEWQEQSTSPEVVAAIIDRLPNKDHPEWFADVRDQFDAARENESLEGDQELDAERQRQIIKDVMPRGETMWNTYNDVTENIWHSDAGDRTKDRKFKKLHRAAPVADGIV